MPPGAEMEARRETAMGTGTADGKKEASRTKPRGKPREVTGKDEKRKQYSSQQREVVFVCRFVLKYWRRCLAC